MGDVPFMPECDIFQTFQAVCSYHSGKAANALRDDRISLVRHGARSFLAHSKVLLSFADLCSLQMPNSECKFFERRSDNSQRAQELSITIPLNDLSGNRGWLETKPSADFLFYHRVKMSETSYCATNFAHGDRFPGPRQ